MSVICRLQNLSPVTLLQVFHRILVYCKLTLFKPVESAGVSCEHSASILMPKNACTMQLYSVIFVDTTARNSNPRLPASCTLRDKPLRPPTFLRNIPCPVLHVPHPPAKLQECLPWCSFFPHASHISFDILPCVVPYFPFLNPFRLSSHLTFSPNIRPRQSFLSAAPSSHVSLRHIMAALCNAICPFFSDFFIKITRKVIKFSLSLPYNPPWN